MSLRRLRGDGGAAPVEFVLVGAMVTALFLAIVQLGIDFHIRNVLAACASEGARHAANADVTDPDAGAAHANELIRKAVGARYATARPGPVEDVDGAPVVTVVVDARLPLIGWMLPSSLLDVHVEGHALKEV